MNQPINQQIKPVMYRTFKQLGLGALFVLGLALPARAAEPTPDELVRRYDAVMSPVTFDGLLVMIAHRQDDTTRSYKFRALKSKDDKIRTWFFEPAAAKGQEMLRVEDNMWVYMPNLSQPVRLSLSQRLTGQVANGDLARANLSGDYNPTILRTETVDGEPMIVLELTAVDRAVTYHRVLYWVREANNRPYKAEFYSLSDRLLKTCRYLDYKTLGGKMRPTRLVMEDALQKGDTSVLEYRDMRMRDLPDKVFTKDYLKHLD